MNREQVREALKEINEDIDDVQCTMHGKGDESQKILRECMDRIDTMSTAIMALDKPPTVSRKEIVTRIAICPERSAAASYVCAYLTAQGVNVEDE